jgi:hypothetical protein
MVHLPPHTCLSAIEESEPQLKVFAYIGTSGHIIPNNLTMPWACPHCNARKWAYIDGEDPISGQAVALFNPRTQAWADHFQWSEQRPFAIEGITAHG